MQMLFSFKVSHYDFWSEGPGASVGAFPALTGLLNHNETHAFRSFTTLLQAAGRSQESSVESYMSHKLYLVTSKQAYLNTDDTHIGGKWHPKIRDTVSSHTANHCLFNVHEFSKEFAGTSSVEALNMKLGWSKPRPVPPRTELVSIPGFCNKDL